MIVTLIVCIICFGVYKTIPSMLQFEDCGTALTFVWCIGVALGRLLYMTPQPINIQLVCALGGVCVLATSAIIEATL